MRKQPLTIALIWLLCSFPFAFAQDVNALNATTTSTTTPLELRDITLTFNQESTTITWTTNIPATGGVAFGRTLALDNTTTDNALVTAHNITIPTIQGIPYYYRITSCDEAGNCKNSPTQQFYAGKLFVSANLPRYSKTPRLEISGKTRPGATVQLLLNGNELRRIVSDRGDFLFREIELRAQPQNVTLIATLGNETATQTQTIEVDTAPASMNVSIPPTATQQPVIANITVSEPVNITITSRLQGEPPLRPGNLQATKIETGQVTLTWNEITGILEYGVYRDGVRIAVSSKNEYVDTSISPGKSYQYQVSAVSLGCIEGDRSDLETVTIPAGSARSDNVTSARLSCSQEPQHFTLTTGRSSVPVPLQQGENLVEVKAVDKAGYVTIVESRVIHDTGAPHFVETNLRNLGPTYQSDVVARGKLSEKGSVTAIVNGKPQKTVLTADDGTFSIPIKLERSTSLQKNSTRAVGQIVWVNKIRLEASDAVGFTTQTSEEKIEYQLCGSGTKIAVELSKPTPEILNPQLLIQGAQQVGLSFTYKYQGGQSATINHKQIKILPIELGPEARKDYDNTLVTYNQRPLGVRSTGRGSTPEGTGYLQFTFRPIDNPWQQLPELAEEKEPSNATTFAKREVIAKHRLKDCLVPGFGCMKLFFELEIPFQETVGPLSTDPLVRRTQETEQTTTQFQRTCVSIELPIDTPIPPRYIPKGLLQTTSELITSIIEGIDTVLKPIQTIGKYLFYTCLAGQGVSLVPIFIEKYQCEFDSVLSSLDDEGRFDPDVAAIGACNEEYSGTNQEEAKRNCNECSNAKRRRAFVDRTYRQVCDRVMCPSAPSLQYYLKQHASQKLTPVTLTSDAAKAKYSGDTYYKEGGSVMIGSDCAALIKKSGQTQAAQQQQTRLRQPPRLFFTYNQVRDIYLKWRDHQTDTAPSDFNQGTSTQGKVNCDDLHPAAPECCGFAYMKEWSSACGVSAFGLDTFNEIEESTCLSAEKANVPGGISLGPNKGSVECGNILNSIGGFCDNDGKETPHTIPVAKACCDTGSGATGVLASLAAPKEQQLYLLLIPQSAQGGTATTGEYNIRLGYVAETIEFDRSPQAGTIPASNQHRINANLNAIEIDSTSIQPYFTQEKIEEYYQKQTISDMQGFRNALCTAAGYNTDQTCPIVGQDIYDQAMAIIGTPDQEYIIRPGDGLVNSLRCICIPTLIAFLQRWRNILGAVRDCMNTILLTGDGSSGVCQAVVSQHACDLLYDAIACFTQKFSAPSGKRLEYSGIGNVMGALTSTGAELSRSVQSRYGETSMYKQVFIEKKLVHSICLFAFTGTWNLDLDAAFDASIQEVPTESYGLLFPCSRRFIGFNPATRPSGLVTWQYQFGAGIAAGADLENVELVLKCSGGFKCRESDGFARGKCDCDTPKELVVNPEGLSTNIAKGQIENKELFITIDGTPGDRQIRYDKAYLRWTWNDGKQTRTSKTDECTISTDGPGATPSICRFDPLSLAFRCVLGDETGNIQFLDATVQPTVNIPTPVFTLNEPVAATLRVRQAIFSETEPSEVKYLSYSIKNSQGREVARSSDEVRVLKNGDYTMSLEDFGARPIVAQNWFGSGRTQNREINQWSSVNNPQTAQPAASAITLLDLRTPEGQEYTLPFNFIIEIKSDSDRRETYTFYDASPERGVSEQTGFNGKRQRLPGASEGVLQRRITYAGADTISGTTDQRVGLPQIIVEFPRAPIGLAPGETRQYLISWGLTPDPNPCENPTAQLQPQPFTITYTAKDSDHFGIRTEQTSIDPITDEPVTKSVTFNAICTTKQDPRIQSQVQSSQTSNVAELIRRIIDSLQPIASKEAEARRTITELVTAARADTADDAARRQIRLRLLRTVDDLLETYQLQTQPFETAHTAFSGQIEKILNPADKTTAETTNTTLTNYKTRLNTAKTRLTTIRTQIARLSEAPTANEISNTATGPLINVIDTTNTARQIEQLEGQVQRAENVYQIYGNNVWTYYPTATPQEKITFRDPRTSQLIEFTYQGGLYRTAATAGEHQVLLLEFDNNKILTYRNDIPVGVIVLKNDGTAITPAPPDAATFATDLQAKTQQFITSILTPAQREPVTSAPACSDDSTTKRICSTSCSTGFTQDSARSGSCAAEKPACCAIPLAQYCAGQATDTIGGIQTNFNLQCATNAPANAQAYPERTCEEGKTCYRTATSTASRQTQLFQYLSVLDTIKTAATQKEQEYETLRTADDRVLLPIIVPNSPQQTELLRALDADAQTLRKYQTQLDTITNSAPSETPPLHLPAFANAQRIHAEAIESLARDLRANTITTTTPLRERLQSLARNANYAKTEAQELINRITAEAGGNLVTFNKAAGTATLVLANGQTFTFAKSRWGRFAGNTNIDLYTSWQTHNNPDQPFKIIILDNDRIRINSYAPPQQSLLESMEFTLSGTHIRTVPGGIPAPASWSAATTAFENHLNSQP